MNNFLKMKKQVKKEEESKITLVEDEKIDESDKSDEENSESDKDLDDTNENQKTKTDI